MSLFKKKKFGGLKPQSEEMSLQITSMADIFTILLVFLLKSYSTSAISVTPDGNMQLPQAMTSDAAVEALAIQVTEKGLQVEGEQIIPLDNYKPDPAEVTAANGSIGKLVAALQKAHEKQAAIAKQNSDVQLDSKIIIVADQRIPYSTLKIVLASAALSGYTDFKLATFKDGG